MGRIETESEERSRRKFEFLCAATENGEIDAFEDLGSEDLALLTARTKTGQRVQDLFDRLKLAGGERD